MTVCADTTILVLEHHGGLRSLARRVLSGQAYHVLEARNATEALDLAGAHPGVDLLICDVDVPQLRARNLATEIRSLHPQIGLLFSSERTDMDLLARGFDIGADVLLKRPFNGTQLMDAVRAALRVEPVVSLDLV